MQILLFPVILLLPIADDPAKPKPDAEALRGEWTVTTGVFAGFPAPADKLRESRIRLLFSEKAFEMVEGVPPKTTLKRRWRIDAARDPKWIDFLNAEKDVVEEVGIYKLDGESLTICLFPSGKADQRPASFKPKIKEPNTLLIARRHK
jgi:uncharacterized protein (TIGR03067 family)